MPNIKLYTAKLSPPGRSVELTAKALGLELDIVPINLLAQEHLTAAFRKLNPQHTIPVIDDNGTIVWDSHAINVYLEPILYYGAAETPQEKIDNLYRAYELLNDTLVDEYIVGNEMTLADLSCIASIASMHAIFPIDAGKYPRLAGWVERLAKLPYYEATNLAGAEELAQLYRAKLEQNRTNAK
uniref:glutathione transferase n=1 Tax=Anopheles arabiensis TaxID=7173 RepID=W5S6M3_ANOAR|nr:glutathione-S-transferase E4 [Anopheles arabiensis]